MLLPVDKLGNVMPRRKTDLDGVIRTLRGVVKFKLAAKIVRRDAHDAIRLGIKIRRAFERLYGNDVLFDLCGGALEIFFANETQKAAQIVRACKRLGAQKRIYFCTFRVGPVNYVWQAVSPVQAVLGSAPRSSLKRSPS